MRVVILDTETTGLCYHKNQVLTIGILLVEFDKENIKVIDSEHIKIKHENYNVQKRALQINRINLEQHNRIGINPRFACVVVNTFFERNKIYNIPVVGHYLYFDINFLKRLFKKCGHEFNHTKEYIDTANIWKELKKSGKIPLALKNSLKNIAEYFNISYEGAHDALNDCYITARVYSKLLNINNKN